MKLLEALARRRAVREFLPDAVQCGVLSELLDIACLAPSHMNVQPWSFTVVDSPAHVNRLGVRALEALRKSLGSKASAEILDPQYEIFYRAPALIVVNATQPGPLADYDCALAAYNIMLAAHSMGLGSCWVSLAQPWLASEEGRGALKLAEDERPVAPIIVGAPAGAPLSPGRYRPRACWLGD